MEKLISAFENKGICFKTEEPMNLYTTFKTGGPAALFAEPSDEQIFLIFSGETTEVFSAMGGKAEAVLSASAPAAVSLLCMASLFLLSIVPSKDGKNVFKSHLE